LEDELKVQLFGRGVLGTAVAQVVIERGWELIWLDGRIEQLGPGEILAPVVINCAGIVKQRQKPPEEFALVNAYGPHHLARLCDAVGSRLIQVSTDCVFGQRDGPSPEYYPPCPEDLYGATKLAGEVIYGKHLTVRTSFVGPGERGLWADISRGVPQHASAWFLWSGHTARFVAQVLAELSDRSSVAGLLHIPGQRIDRWSLVNALVDYLQVSTPVIRNDAYRRDRRLVSVRYAELRLPPIKSFAEELADLVRLRQEAA
jgi:dTDP-4-dehydrorhamnose reductase